VLAVVIVGAVYFAYQASTVETGDYIKWLGHASFQIKAGDRTIYIDPYEGDYRDKADIILVTHSHADHCNVSIINSIRKSDTIIIAPADAASKIGGEVRVVKAGDKLMVGEVLVEAVEAYNDHRFSSPGVPYHPKGFGVGYLLTIWGKTIYHAGDTDAILEMQSLKNIYLALLPTGGTYTMDTEEAIEAALVIKPTYAIPMHRLYSAPTEFKVRVEAASDVKVVLLKPGEQFQLE
jgi:L-ascorbate metabolism protein UlaG (beta-lactamase superfamily)